MWRENIIVRKWVQYEISREFRVFVFQNKITAISQYFDVLYFPEIVQHKNNIEMKIRKFFENFTIDYENYVVDFAVLNFEGEYKENDVLIIEFNPFTKFTSSCLFHKNEYDRLFIGKLPFEFRVVTERLPVLRKPKNVETENIMLNIQDVGLLEEHKELLEMVQSHLQDDLERINSNLRYVLNKRKKDL